MADWPDTPFKESMLKSNPVIVHCPEEALVSELFSICYRVTRGHKLSYAETCDYDDYPSEYIKCTFYGTAPDIEIPDDGFEAIISAVGRG